MPRKQSPVAERGRLSSIEADSRSGIGHARSDTSSAKGRIGKDAAVKREVMDADDRDAMRRLIGKAGDDIQSVLDRLADR